MGARSYTPQLGRFLQTDPIPGGSANPYAYTNSDPVNQTDLTGDYVENDYVLALGIEQNAIAIELEAAREAAIRKEAEERAREAAIQAQFEAQAKAELAEAEARNLWDAEAAAGPPGSIAGGGIEEEGEYGGGGDVVSLGLIDGGRGPGDKCGSMYGKPCNHNGGGGNGTDTACAIMGILDFIPGVFESPPGFVVSAYCAGYAAGKVVRNG